MQGPFAGAAGWRWWQRLLNHCNCGSCCTAQLQGLLLFIFVAPLGSWYCQIHQGIRSLKKGDSFSVFVPPLLSRDWGQLTKSVRCRQNDPVSFPARLVLSSLCAQCLISPVGRGRAHQNRGISRLISVLSCVSWFDHVSVLAYTYIYIHMLIYIYVSLPMNVNTRTQALTQTVGGTSRISKATAVACAEGRL